MSESGRADGKLKFTGDSSAAGKRVFFALWPDQLLRAALADISRQVHSCCGGHPTRAASLHMTVVFIGAVPETRICELRALAAEVRFARFAVELEALGCWRHNHIAWIAPRSAPSELNGLVFALETRLEGGRFGFDRRPFAPHVTLVKKADCKADLPDCAPLSWQVGEFVLVESATERPGAYQIIDRWPCD